MEFSFVDSSTIDQIGYDEDQQEVHVIFKSGQHYIYSDVSSDVWDQFRDASSKGKFLNEEFKAKGYSYRMV
jgi:hypothetical protein